MLIKKFGLYSQYSYFCNVVITLNINTSAVPAITLTRKRDY